MPTPMSMPMSMHPPMSMHLTPMSMMDGPATIRVLKKMDPNVKIIAASGLMDSEKVKDATGMDNIAFLMKPFTADKLLHAVHKALSE